MNIILKLIMYALIISFFTGIIFIPLILLVQKYLVFRILFIALDIILMIRMIAEE